MTPTTKEINKAKAIRGRNRTEKVDETQKRDNRRMK
jgi:hypothetical protein